MRLSVVSASVLAIHLLLVAGAQACAPAVARCLPAVVVFPAYTPAGGLIGRVEAPVRRLPRLERSRFTNQLLTIVYNDPGNGFIDPGVVLMRLPRVGRSMTQAAYPIGY